MKDSNNKIDDCWNTIGVWSYGIERCPKLQGVYHCRNCPTYAAAGREVLNRPLPTSYREEWSSLLAEEKVTEPTNTKAIFVFRAGKEWLALPATTIREVVDMGPIHTIPHASNNILRGLVNVKGRLEICVSIGAVLGIERNEETEEKSNYLAPERLAIVVHNNRVIAFPVSEILGVIRYREDSLKDLPVTISGSKAVYASGILCFKNMDIAILKEEPLFLTLTRDIA